MEWIKVIIVEDNNFFKTVIEDYLHRLGKFRIIGKVSNGEEFLGLLKKDIIPDIVLMDIVMPKMDGIKATKEALKICDSIKIIGVTINDNNYYSNLLIEAGAVACISKSVVINKLMYVIDNVLEGKSYVLPIK